MHIPALKPYDYVQLHYVQYWHFYTLDIQQCLINCSFCHRNCYRYCRAHHRRRDISHCIQNFIFRLNEEMNKMEMVFTSMLYLVGNYKIDFMKYIVFLFFEKKSHLVVDVLARQRYQILLPILLSSNWIFSAKRRVVEILSW